MIYRCTPGSGTDVYDHYDPKVTCHTYHKYSFPIRINYHGPKQPFCVFFDYTGKWT